MAAFVPAAAAAFFIAVFTVVAVPEAVAVGAADLLFVLPNMNCRWRWRRYGGRRNSASKFHVSPFCSPVIVLCVKRLDEFRFSQSLAQKQSAHFIVYPVWPQNTLHEMEGNNVTSDLMA